MPVHATSVRDAVLRHTKAQYRTWRSNMRCANTAHRITVLHMTYGGIRYASTGHCVVQLIRSASTGAVYRRRCQYGKGNASTETQHTHSTERQDT
eukprot:3566365-Rhodomonas_salina.1